MSDEKENIKDELEIKMKLEETIKNIAPLVEPLSVAPMSLPVEPPVQIVDEVPNNIRNGNGIWANDLISVWETAIAAHRGSIQSIVIEYRSHTSGTAQPPTTGWTNAIPNVAQGAFLWTRMILTLKDGTSSQFFSVARQGEQGATGPQGEQGATGATGPQGEQGNDGLTPRIVNREWWIGDTNTGVVAKGQQGVAGVNSSGGLDMGSKIVTVSYYDWQENLHDRSFTVTITREQHGLPPSSALLAFTKPFTTGNKTAQSYDSPEIDNDGTITIRADEKWEGIVVIASGITEIADLAARELANRSIGMPVFDNTSFRFTFTANNGEVMNIDLPVEEFRKSFDFDESTNELIIITGLGVERRVDISEVIPIFVGGSTGTIQVLVNENDITANLLNGSVDTVHLTQNIRDSLTRADNSEPKFDKNTAFNVNFGIGENEVRRGNDTAYTNSRHPLTHGHNAIDINENFLVAGNNVSLHRNETTGSITINATSDGSLTKPPFEIPISFIENNELFEMSILGTIHQKSWNASVEVFDNSINEFVGVQIVRDQENSNILIRSDIDFNGVIIIR